MTDRNPATNATNEDHAPSTTPQWSTLLQSFNLFTHEQHDALDDPTDAHQQSQHIVYTHNPPCPEHHEQLLDSLQLGGPTDDQGLFLTQLDHTHTSAGKHTLWKWLEHPLTQSRDIQLRRKMRETLVSGSALRTTLATMEEEWRSMCWCWDEATSKTELVNNLLFTGYFASFNEMPVLVNVYHFMRVCGTPLIHCLAPIVPVVLSFGMLKWMGAGMSFRECWDMSTGVFKNALWFDGGGNHNAFATIFQHGGGAPHNPLLNSVRKVVPKLMTALKWVWWAVFLINIVLMVHQCYRHYKLLCLVYQRTLQACTWLQRAVSMSPQYSHLDPTNATHQHLQQLLNWCNTAPPSFSLFTDTHAFLQAYTTLRTPTIRDVSERLLRQVGVMDALQSVDVLAGREGFCVPEISTPENNTENTTENNTTTNTENTTENNTTTNTENTTTTTTNAPPPTHAPPHQRPPPHPHTAEQTHAVSRQTRGAHGEQRQWQVDGAEDDAVERAVGAVVGGGVCGGDGVDTLCEHPWVPAHDGRLREGVAVPSTDTTH
jgi:hypothetical protein